MINFEIVLQGTGALLMHSSRLSNPLDPAAKALKRVSAKRTKTDEDHLEMARLEHAGGLYHDASFGPFIPGENIARALVDGAKLTKRGVKVTRGVFISSDVNPLSYDGPRDLEGLWEDPNFRHMASVKVGTARVMRCRPTFSNWAVQAQGVLDTEVLELDELADIATTAGQLIGLGDWRPRFGRFEAKVERV